MGRAGGVGFASAAPGCAWAQRRARWGTRHQTLELLLQGALLAIQTTRAAVASRVLSASLMLSAASKKMPPRRFSESRLDMRDQAVNLALRFLGIAALLVVKDHQVDLQLAAAPEGMRLQASPDQGQLLFDDPRRSRRIG